MILDALGRRSGRPVLVVLLGGRLLLFFEALGVDFELQDDPTNLKHIDFSLNIHWFLNDRLVLLFELVLEAFWKSLGLLLDPLGGILGDPWRLLESLRRAARRFPGGLVAPGGASKRRHGRINRDSGRPGAPIGPPSSRLLCLEVVFCYYSELLGSILSSMMTLQDDHTNLIKAKKPTKQRGNRQTI